MPLSPSPIVQGYMSPEMMGQQPQEEPISADQMFEKRFGDSAFNMLKSKFPNLMSRVVTFRVLEADVQKGSGIGCFIVQSGKNVRYIPVVMADGAVVSCEFLYDKDSDQFVSMTPSNVQALLMQNMLHSGEIMSGDAHVEDTKDLFRNLVRPPASSNVVMASPRDAIAELPNSAKEKIANWLNDNPEFTAKIASIYNIEELGSRLSPREEKTAEEQAIVTVYDLAKIAADVASTLSSEESDILLKHGYLVKRAEDSKAVVATKEDFSDTLKSSIGFELYKPNEPADVIKYGKAMCLRPSGIEYIPVLFVGTCCLFKDGTYTDLSYKDTAGVVVKGLTDNVTAETLKVFGAKAAKSFIGATGYDKVLVTVPMKSGKYKDISSKVNISGYGKTNSKKIDKDVYISCYDSELHVSSWLDYGYVQTGDTMHVPANSLFFFLDYEKRDIPHGLARSLDDFLLWISKKGTSLTVVDDDISTDITDNTTKKTAHFFSKAAAAEHLATNYGLDQAQTESVLANRHSYVFNKVAFGPQVQANPNTGMEMQMYPQMMGGTQMSQSVMPNGVPQQPTFNPAPMETAANIGDPDIMDTGILSSFSQDPDIKTLLVDYLPDFINTIDKLARIITLLSINKKDTEEFYGHDKYATLISNCRKMVKLTSDIIESLQRYVRMS